MNHSPRTNELPQSLKEWSEKEAEKITETEGDNGHAAGFYLSGVSALHAHLMEMGMGEFDEKAVKAQANTQCSIGPLQVDGFFRGAYWQHQQNAATIALLKGDLNKTLNRVKELEQKMEKAKEALKFIVFRQDLAFAECSEAELIYGQARKALEEIE